MRLHRSLFLLAALGLASAGCQETAKTTADTLVYTDPAGTGPRLVRNPDLSTPARVVLDLVGAAGTSGMGVAFIVSADQAKATWVNPPSSSSKVLNVAFQLGSGTQAFVSKVDADQLQGAASQKPGTAAVHLSQPLLRISLELKPELPANTSIPLVFVGGNWLQPTGGPLPLPVSVGTLVAR
jgi:hypothetical protein